MTANTTNTTIPEVTMSNGSYVTPEPYDFSTDASWILTSTFTIFTMQTGFGMLESGCISIKNEVNIMIKIVIDIVMGGFTYWIFGYGMSFGKGSLSNPFIGIGNFFADAPVGDPEMGHLFAAFLFQLSFATTATTIVGGAMAERITFKAYCLFSLLNTAVYCISAGWVWGEHGFLNNLGAVDIAGSGPVHLIGGVSAFVSAIMLGPRLGRYSKGREPLPMGNPVNVCLGLFFLWWGWLAFNSGSTYGLTGLKWQYAARAAVMTILASFGGGISSCCYSMWRNDGRLDIVDFINGILGSLVSVTAGCFLYRSWEAILIGCLGALLCCLSMPVFDRFGVDDPVGASAVHGVCGIWGVIAVGLFADNPIPLLTTTNRSGLLKGGGWYLLGIQSLTAVCLACWGICATFLLLFIIKKIVRLRMDPAEELLGGDITDHRIRNSQIDLLRAISALEPLKINLEEIPDIKLKEINSSNSGHNEPQTSEEKLQLWRMYVQQMDPTRPKAIDSDKSTQKADCTLTRRVKLLRGNTIDKSDNGIENEVGGIFKSQNLEISTLHV